MSRLAGCPSVFSLANSREEIFHRHTYPRRVTLCRAFFRPRVMTSRGEAARDCMKRLLMCFLLLLGAAGVVGAQEKSSPAEGTKTAASLELTSAPQVSLLGASAESSEAPSVAATAEGEAPATPPAKPRFVFGDRDDYRWQLGMGVEIFRFLSSRFDSTMVGTNTMVTYFTNGFFAFEGNVVTGFGSQIFQNEHPKLFGGGGGIRVGSRRARWEP